MAFAKAKERSEATRAQMRHLVTLSRMRHLIIDRYLLLDDDFLHLKDAAWQIVNMGRLDHEDGRIYLHLSSLIRATAQKNGMNPAQIVDFVKISDHPLLETALASAVSQDDESPVQSLNRPPSRNGRRFAPDVEAAMSEILMHDRLDMAVIISDLGLEEAARMLELRICGWPAGAGPLKRWGRMRELLLPLAAEEAEEEDEEIP